MSKVVKVRLNNASVEDTNFIYLVGGKDESGDDNVYNYGLSIFYNEEYVLNFIISDDDLEVLTSDFKSKFVKDIGFTFNTYGYNLEIMKYVNVIERSNALKNRIEKELKETQVFCNSELFDTITFISEYRDAFAKGLKEALLHPVVGCKTYCELPSYDESIEF